MLFELVEQLVALSNTLTNATKDACATVARNDIVHQFQDQHALPACSATEHPGFTTAHDREQKVYHLDACFKDLGLGARERAHIHAHLRRVLMDRRSLSSVNRAHAIDGLAHAVHNATEQLFAHGYRQRLTGGYGSGVALQVLG